jgi:O-antigen ligase
VAIPVLFLHLRYQPTVHVGLGSTSVGIELSDVAVLGVVAAGAWWGVREGWKPLLAARWLWLVGAAFLALVVAGTLYPLLPPEHYRFLTHLVTAAKFCEYALLAPAVVLLLRRPREALPLLISLSAWAAVATGWAVLQFAGLVVELEGKRPLQREPSFVGVHDFAALAGAAFVLGSIAFASEPRRRWTGAAGVSVAAGALGVALSGAFAAAAGTAVAALAGLVLLRARTLLSVPRGAAVVGATALLLAGVLLIRGGEVRSIAHSIGIGRESHVQAAGVQSYVQRSLLVYIGLRMYADHPVLGVGWEGSQDADNYRPYLADAHRRYPHAPAVAFPAPTHSWGVQNAYVQILSDLGSVGGLLLAALVLIGLGLGTRTAMRAGPGLVVAGSVGALWLVVAAGTWTALGLVAGIPLDALSCLAFGLVAAAAAWTLDARGS